MVEQVEGETRRSWLRLGCPVCGGWLAVPGDVGPGVRAERVARRIDAFVYRHVGCTREEVKTR